MSGDGDLDAVGYGRGRYACGGADYEAAEHAFMSEVRHCMDIAKGLQETRPLPKRKFPGRHIIVWVS
jgi:hypothetical protein